MSGEPLNESEPPELSVIMPVRNEAAHLDRSVRAVLAQDYPKPIEVVLAVGPSSDGTEEVASRLQAIHDRVLVVPNPSGATAPGLNAAIAASRGDMIARVDGHCELADGYLHTAVRTLEATGAQVVGGIQDAQGERPTQRAIAFAMTSPFGVGNSKFHYGGKPGPTDTVYLGVFRRDAIKAAGGFDETLVRNQDYELNWRIREAGGTVWFDPALRVTYRPRSSLRSLAKQYFEYGQWKREVWARHPRSLKPRHLAAPAMVAVNLVALALALCGRRRWQLIPAAYAGAAVIASAIARNVDPAARRRMPAAFATMHHAWGLGFLVGPIARSSDRPVDGRRARGSDPIRSRA